MGNKQTAVEFLLNKVIFITEYYDDDGNKFNYLTTRISNEDIQQAKEMEKEQNREFYNEGKDFSSYTHDEQYGGVEYWDREPLGFEDYYNEQYGKS